MAETKADERVNPYFGYFMDVSDTGGEKNVIILKDHQVLKIDMTSLPIEGKRKIFETYFVLGNALAYRDYADPFGCCNNSNSIPDKRTDRAPVRIIKKVRPCAINVSIFFTKGATDMGSLCWREVGSSVHNYIPLKTITNVYSEAKSPFFSNLIPSPEIMTQHCFSIKTASGFSLNLSVGSPSNRKLWLEQLWFRLVKGGRECIKANAPTEPFLPSSIAI
ncbi:MAG: hypothetical protein Hyperionvirus4_140 [Hyperionvirus sp.]|uniref:PH domain-containing protein n=1 Tax=Hyperionvirus sp. TaxID=2487770 RepID=A0A3G5A7G7_9VIRU|nr:MAG: hypothetical protein Hyperionvirus4_140 [Hyperionvirus sp.]